MQALPKAFWDIALWRRDPGCLPDSSTLVVMSAMAYAALSAVQSWMLYGADQLFSRTAADLMLLALPNSFSNMLCFAFVPMMIKSMFSLATVFITKLVKVPISTFVETSISFLKA